MKKSKRSRPVEVQSLKNQSPGMDRRTFLKGVSVGAAATFAVPAVLSAQSEPKAVRKDVFEKIDIFCHILPPKYKDALFQILPKGSFFYDTISVMPQFWDVEARFKLTDPIPGYVQLLSLMQPPIETVADPTKAVELAKLANDGMADLVKQYPTKFVGALAALPMNNMEAALKELDRCITQLGFKGVQIFTPSNGKALDSAELIPLYEKMAKYNLPIWIHPNRDESEPFYMGDPYAKFRENVSWGWPFETTLGESRLVYSGLMVKYPNLKFIVHHGGAMIPFLQSRISTVQNRPGGQPAYGALTKPPVEYFKLFYPDVAAMVPNSFTLEYSFYGADNIVFGTDFPFGNLSAATSRCSYRRGRHSRVPRCYQCRQKRGDGRCC